MSTFHSNKNNINIFYVALDRVKKVDEGPNR
jgi:hypothetical protein